MNRAYLVGMMGSRHRTEANARFEERRNREHESLRLRDRIPELATLRLEIVEGRGETKADPKHARIVMVDTAPALFVLPCADHACRDGGHDLTHAILRGLQSGSPRFEIEDDCRGSISATDCGRKMHVTVLATYNALTR